MTVGELIGALYAAMGRGELSMKSKVTVPVDVPDEPNKIVTDIVTDVDGDEVELSLADPD